jgi:hypothetical protein
MYTKTHIYLSHEGSRKMTTIRVCATCLTLLVQMRKCTSVHQRLNAEKLVVNGSSSRWSVRPIRPNVNPWILRQRLVLSRSCLLWQALRIARSGTFQRHVMVCAFLGQAVRACQPTAVTSHKPMSGLAAVPEATFPLRERTNSPPNSRRHCLAPEAVLQI